MIDIIVMVVNVCSMYIVYYRRDMFNKYMFYVNIWWVGRLVSIVIF